jgi:S-adenosylmethionine hydrolase
MQVLTLLSDLGTKDATVAAAKGILLQTLPAMHMVDISHSLEREATTQAAYVLASAYPYFPAHTFHVVFYNLYAGTQPPSLLLFCANGHYFLSPDNGVLPLALRQETGEAFHCYTLPATKGFKDWVHAVADVVKTVQTCPQAEWPFTPCTPREAPPVWQPHIAGNRIIARVIYIDRFENAVLNVSRQQFEAVGQGRPFRLTFGRNLEINTLLHHYNQVRRGADFCRFNALGFLEIGMNQGNAAGLMGLQIYRETGQMAFHEITIDFT